MRVCGIHASLSRLLLVLGLALALALGQFTPSNAHAKRVALVMGNSAYADAPLRNTVNDAADLSTKLRDLGFEVTTLTNLDRPQMARAILAFGRAAQGAEAALFYFAGHGVQIRGKNYLLPTGQRFADEAEVEANGVDVNTVLARLEESAPKVSLLILDACRSAPLQRRVRTAARGLARMEAPSGALIAFAAQPGAEAGDGSGRNGTFTKHLLAHIDTPGLAVEQLFKRVRVDVERETRRAQSPREESSLTADFYFRSPIAPVRPEDHQRIEDEAWQAAKRANTRASFQAYLALHPRGRYAAAAKVAIEGLPPERPVSPAATAAAGCYWLQIGQYASLDEAEVVRAKAALFGYRNVVVAESIGARAGPRFTVRVGPYRSPEEIHAPRTALQRGGVSSGTSIETHTMC